jgi:hypothetical protein
LHGEKTLRTPKRSFEDRPEPEPRRIPRVGPTLVGDNGEEAIVTASDPETGIIEILLPDGAYGCLRFEEDGTVTDVVSEFRRWLAEQN